MQSRLRISNFIILTAFIFLSGCVTIYNPATQQRETLLINTASEVALGRDMDIQIQKKFNISADKKVQQRISNIGRKIAFSSDRQDLSYQFRVIEDEELNAFAIPGGFVYVNSGLFDAVSDDELAAVFAHEVGHIAARHSVKKLQAALGYQIVMDIILGLSEKEGIIRATDTVFNIISLGYSRQDELLADKLSVKYASKAGFNPQGAVSMLEKLKKESQKKGPNFNIAFLSSHPPIEERIKNIKNEIALNR